MKRRRWDSKTKTKIVLEGLSGRPVSEICNEYEINQNQYYTWRDKFLSEAHRAFESKKDGGEVNRLCLAFPLLTIQNILIDMALETRFSVFVENRVAMLNELCTAISEANINIRGLSTVVEAEWAIVGLIVDDVNKTKEVLHKQNLKFGESTVLTVGMDNKPGQIAKITKKLSEQHIDIGYASLTAEGEHCLLVLMTTDNKKANEILG